MFKEMILTILDNVWPMLLIFSIILTSLRIVWSLINEKRIVFYHDILILGFILYILCLFHVVTFQDVSWSTSNFIPFKEIFRYDFGTILFYRNVVGNMLMFIPYGFFIGYILKTKKTWIILLLSILTSITIEGTQLVIGRVFDVDDILLNIVGGILGYYLYLLCTSFKEHLPSFLKKTYIYNIIIVIILVITIFYLLGII